MVCYNLYLNMDYLDYQTGEKVECDPVFLQLGYHSYQEACQAKEKLETVYEKGTVFISACAPRISLLDGA